MKKLAIAILLLAGCSNLLLACHDPMLDSIPVWNQQIHAAWAISDAYDSWGAIPDPYRPLTPAQDSAWARPYFWHAESSHDTFWGQITLGRMESTWVWTDSAHIGTSIEWKSRWPGDSLHYHWTSNNYFGALYEPTKWGWHYTMAVRCGPFVARVPAERQP